jgi:hypothetical protein
MEPFGHCQVGQKFAHQLKVADYHSAASGPQKRAFDQSTQPGHFRQTDPVLPQLDNAVGRHLDVYQLAGMGHSPKRWRSSVL